MKLNVCFWLDRSNTDDLSSLQSSLIYSYGKPKLLSKTQRRSFPRLCFSWHGLHSWGKDVVQPGIIAGSCRPLRILFINRS